MRFSPHATLAIVAALSGATGALAQDSGEFDDTDQGIDWSVALRGSYASNSLTGGQGQLTVNPEASLTLDGQSSRSTVGAGADIVVDDAGNARFSEIRAAAESTYRLDSVTSLDGSITGSLGQLSPNDSSLPVNTLHAPLTADGKVQGSVTRDFGGVDVKATLDGERYVRGPTTLDDLSTVDNSHLSFWAGGATLRVGYELTPLLSAFVEGEASMQMFDAPSPTLLTYLHGRTYQLRSGISYNQGSIVSAEGSVGYAWLDYVDPSLTDAPSWVYNGSLTFRPDETLSLTSGLETTLGPSANVAGDTDVAYAATASARYAVNPWLSLRGSAGWDQTVTLGTGDVSWGINAGAGLDYRSSRYVVWTADYAFARDYAPPTPSNDTHTVTVGVRVQR